jgi:hypothetical protein
MVPVGEGKEGGGEMFSRKRRVILANKLYFPFAAAIAACIAPILPL